MTVTRSRVALVGSVCGAAMFATLVGQRGTVECGQCESHSEFGMCLTPQFAICNDQFAIHFRSRLA